ncbi:MAG: ABC transporter substrate-binding protein [Candidatus Promineifilaceae bacterium]|nr:ABC transporter substrate-binding protein [Candidatus Promineifilaceae bacterium]
MISKPNIRWQLLLAVLCLGLVLALLSYQAQSASLCTTRVPAAGGRLVEGVVGAPRHLNPLLSDPNPVDRELTSLIFDGLTRMDAEGRLVPALARGWTVEEDGRTVHFSLRDDVVWHDGEPLTADDVVFTYSLLKDEGFPAPAAARQLWQSVAITRTGRLSVTFTLPEPYSPFLEATTRGILPAHLLSDVAPAEIPEHDFNIRPVGTGPFLVPAGENWQRAGRLRLAPNPQAWQAFQVDGVEFRFYPDRDLLLEAYRAGAVQAINNVPPVMIPEVAALADVRLYTAPLPRYTQLLFNLTEEGHPALGDRQVRHGLAHALDREMLIGGALNGQGLPLYGPYPTQSWAYNPAALSIYAHNPFSATVLLDEAGWTLAEGAALRAREEEPFSLRLLFLDTPRQERLAAALAAQWASVGIGVDLIAVEAAALRNALAERAFDVALIDIAATGDPDLYDFWSQEAIVKGQNYAGWNDRRASEALEMGRQLWDLDERRIYYDAFLRIFSRELPALTLYQHVYTYAVGESIKQLEIGRIDHPRERYETLSDWFLLYRDVAVYCPEQ